MNKLSTPAAALIIIILSVKLTLNFKPLYYYDINHLNIISNTNLKVDEIKSAYDYLIYYVTGSQKTDFNIPNLPSSKEGSIHFQEVKNIFTKLNYILYACILIFMFGLYTAYKKKNFIFLKYSSFLSILFTISLAIPFCINFDSSFTIFHKIFFSNNYWIFDPALDPVINILPEEFFFHCAALILILIVLFSAVIFISYKFLNIKFNPSSQGD
ncbi:MAG: TIGR01906 family membrane protein [Solirubrobacterales bacterium]